MLFIQQNSVWCANSAGGDAKRYIQRALEYFEKDYVVIITTVIV